MSEEAEKTGMLQAITICAVNSCEGVDAEYRYVESVLGLEDEKWHLCFQELFFDDAGVPFDKLTVESYDGTLREFWFDISFFYGKY